MPIDDLLNAFDTEIAVSTPQGISWPEPIVF